LFAFRETGTQLSPVTMSCPSWRAAALPCLPLFIKDMLKEDMRLLAFALGCEAFCLWLLPFAFGFLVWEAFGWEKNY
jgi:hypothetical protein